MRKQIGIFLAGAVTVAPIAITLAVVWWLASVMSNLGKMPLTGLIKQFSPLASTQPTQPNESAFQQAVLSVAGVLVVLAVVYLVGLLARLWVFRALLALLERIISRVPGVKTIYESVRDLMALFGSDSGRMGHVVEYTLPGTQLSCLAILTNENPQGINVAGTTGHKVAVYLPFSYMLGGVTVLVGREHLRKVDMTVEEALKLSAIAHVSSAMPPVAKPKSADKKDVGGQS
ncbi:MAG: DUF502 domain-containing protein [Phycisphaerae bacterium]|jgi:uncharacterized membrane protein